MTQDVFQEQWDAENQATIFKVAYGLISQVHPVSDTNRIACGFVVAYRHLSGEERVLDRNGVHCLSSRAYQQAFWAQAELV